MNRTAHHRGGRTIRRHLGMHMIGPHHPVLTRGAWNMAAVPPIAQFRHVQRDGPVERALQEAALRGATARLLAAPGGRADTSLLVGLSVAERYNFEERDGQVIALPAVDEVRSCLAEGCELDAEEGGDFCAFHELAEAAPGLSDHNRWREVVPLVEDTDGRRHWDGFAQGTIRKSYFVMPGVIWRPTIIEPARPRANCTVTPQMITDFIATAEQKSPTPLESLTKPAELAATQAQWERFVRFTHGLLGVNRLELGPWHEPQPVRRLDGSYMLSGAAAPPHEEPRT